MLTHPSLSARSHARFRLPVPLLPRASRAPSNPSCTPLAAPVPIPATSRRRASIPRAPSRATSPRSSFVPPRTRSRQPWAESAPVSPTAIVAPRRSSASPSSSPPRPPSAQIESSVSFLATHSSSPSFSPFGSGHAAAGLTPRRRGRSVRRRRTPRAAPAQACSPSPRAPRPRALPERCTAEPLDRLAPPRPERPATADAASRRRPSLASRRRRSAPLTPPPCAGRGRAGPCAWAARATPPAGRPMAAALARVRRHARPVRAGEAGEHSSPLLSLFQCHVVPTGQGLRVELFSFC